MILHHKSFGSGDPVIILHGLFGSLDNWQTVGKALSGSYLVILADLRNHGRSPHDAHMDLPSMAGDVRELALSRGLSTFHLIGHSLGGKVAMQLASDHPDLLDRLIVVDIAPRKYAGGHDHILDALSRMRPEDIADRAAADTLLSRDIPDFAVRQFLLKNLVRKEGGGFGWKMNLPAIEENYASIMDAVNFNRPYTKPTLFVRGGRSGYVTEEDLPAIRKQFVAARFVTIPESGHWVHAETPEKLLDAVRRFLDPKAGP